jgi:hypothetical protein
VKACALLGALTVSSCSLLLDWNGYTGGSTSSRPDASMGGDDAMTQDDANDVAVGSNDAPDAPDARGPEDATNDAADVLDASGLTDATGDVYVAPLCSSDNCGGCCIPSRNYCSGGSADQTCGVGGQKCTDCTASGFVCDKTNGVCRAPPADGGAPQACVVSQCASLQRCNPNFQMACCTPFTNVCGCHIIFDPTPATCL